MSQERWQTLAEDLGRIFLGWKLREDYDALLAIGEGALRIDLLTAEAWCEGEPLPPLFIAGELRSELEKVSNEIGAPLQTATLDAEFHTRQEWHPDGDVPTLDIACRVSLRVGDEEFTSETNNQSGELQGPR